MKKFLFVCAVLFLAVALFAGGGAEGEDADMMAARVGMVTDAGTIDDKSFNQGTWEGILLAADDFELDTKYLKPVGTTEADYILEISNLYDGGYRFIVTPGFKFETTIYQAQDEYSDAYFVLLDGAPHAGDFNATVGPNTVSIFFAEHESGFLAGVAASLEMGEGEFGFIGGLEIPPVQKFNWGFQQGVAYANANLGTNMTLDAENIIYQGSFDNVAAGQQIAAQMYDKGVDAIFCAAGGVGVGAINEAKSRAKAGEDVWIVGVDVDQYADGIYEGSDSVILTSAVKKVGQAAYDMIESFLDDAFPGGQTLVFDASTGGVGIPEDNPNLSASVTREVDAVLDGIISGSIAVNAEQGNLIP